MKPAHQTILINHLGYESLLPKKFVINAPQNSSFDKFEVVDQHQVVRYHGMLAREGQVDNWKNQYYWSGDFSELTKTGYYRIIIKSNSTRISSKPFVIKKDVYFQQIIPEILTYFELSRCIDEYDDRDKQMTFYGKRTGTVDVSGGWYDASGDVSKYLSHLSYANYLNPQQTPLAVYHFLFAAELLQQSGKGKFAPYIDNFIEEGIYGADFLMRMNDEAGYFYTTVFDVWSHQPAKREICAYETQKGIKNENYQAAYREGGGIAIAALAKASTLFNHGDFNSSEYLETAQQAFQHLELNGPSYCHDGKENIIDHYCALLAAVELYRVTQQKKYLESARIRKSLLVGHLQDDSKHRGWWSATEDGSRPFHHASDAGLPILSLLKYLEIETLSEFRKEVIDTINQSLVFEIQITNEVNNPFGYARQYIKSLNGPKRGSFFIPHQNKSDYWWQGENARLASLATAVLLSKSIIEPAIFQEYNRYAINQLNWIIGLNPFDMCMVEGLGRNNPKYGEWNVRGGIANGITSGFNDESDIAFMPKPYDQDINQNWRWPEQWQPHAAWMLLALSALEYSK